MNDTKPFLHGSEGTHYCCKEILDKFGGKAMCCGCTGHNCEQQVKDTSTPNMTTTHDWEEKELQSVTVLTGGLKNLQISPDRE